VPVLSQRQAIPANYPLAGLLVFKTGLALLIHKKCLLERQAFLNQ
jgi:hypothetical protein